MVPAGLADLHRHLDGSLRWQTLREFAQQDALTVPKELAFRAGMGLQEALARFAFTLSVLQSPQRVERVAAEICEDAASDGVRTLEIRFAPQLHQGAPVEAVVSAALRGIAGRAGLILCGLYGESPAVFETLVEVGAKYAGVVGLDLAGGPAPGHRYQMRDYAEAFGQAKAQGLGRTVHAAEGRDVGEIRQAIELLHAQRIGHGTTLLDDEDIVAIVVERGITLEACPTSNVHTGAIARLNQHPLRQWLERGVRVCLCPDNTLLSQVGSRQEHQRVQQALALSDEQLAHVVACGHQARFAMS